MARRLCFALDLVNDAGLIAQYEWFHQPEQARPAVIHAMLQSGILNLEIYRVMDRLVMIMEVGEDFDIDRKSKADADNPDILSWEWEMSRFQRSLLGPAAPKWAPMAPIYSLAEVMKYLAESAENPCELPSPGWSAN